MSGNFMFIVCEPCSKANEPDFGFKFAERGIIGCYEPFGPAKQTQQLATWLKKHRHCAGKGKPDHFLLAHAGERNWDQPKMKTSQFIEEVRGCGPINPEKVN